MNPPMLFLIPTALTALLAADPLPAQALDLARIEAVADSAAQAQIAAGDVPGMTIAVARNGEIVFSRGYGRANLEMGVAAGPETVYTVTSITKQITAAFIMRLVDAGKLSLDDSITKYLPDYPAQGRHVTVRHLLNHTSGISPMRGTGSLSDTQWFKRDLAYQEMVDLFGKQPFDFEPGAGYAYNNMAYYLAGEIITRVTGTPWTEHLERELGALGMRHTMYCDARRLVPNRADAYVAENGGFVNAPYVSIQILGASGAFCSNAADLVRWSHLLHGGQVVSPTSLRQMTTRTVLTTGDTVDYGFGLYVDRLGTHRKLYHGGTRPGGSYLAHYPDDGLTIAVLTNAAGTGREKATEVEDALARAVFGLEVPDLPITADEIARYEGTYTLQAGGRTLDVRVFGQDGRLHAQPEGQDATRLLNQGSHVFIAEADNKIRFVFTVQDGRVQGVTLHQNGREFPGTRKP
jgi:D-alanyl-D-alanine carboxypeptidase